MTVRPTEGLALAVRVSLGATAVLLLASAVAALRFRDAIAPDPLTMGRVETEVSGALGPGSSVVLLSVLAWIVTGVLWLVWEHRLTSTLWARGARGLRLTPGWSVAWWFIPYASLVMPALAMRELRRAATGDAEAADARAGGWIVWAWWVTFQGGAVTWFVGSALTPAWLERGASPTPPELAQTIRIWAAVAAGYGGVLAAAAVFAIVLIGQVQGRLRAAPEVVVPPRPDAGWPVTPSVRPGFVPRGAGLRGIATAVRVSLWVQVVVLTAAAATELWEASVLDAYLDGRTGTLGPATRVDGLVVTAFGLWFLALIVTAVLWCVWQGQAHAVLRARLPGARSPWWLVWWFVPLASYAVPYVAVRELWRGERGGRWWVLPVWWCTWVAGWIVLQFGGEGFTPQAQIQEALRGVAQAMLFAASAALAVQVVRSTTERLATGDPSPGV